MICQELPPHARRIQMCAVFRDAGRWNYLCMRGEYESHKPRTIAPRELPPHARRIQKYHDHCDYIAGTTSACAGNTRPAAIPWGCRGNYLRVRGEYGDGGAKLGFGLELPPHARRIHGGAWSSKTRHGTTSACAENTTTRCRHAHGAWNYLRMRGEYPVQSPIWVYFWELPPHARRIQRIIGF